MLETTHTYQDIPEIDTKILQGNKETVSSYVNNLNLESKNSAIDYLVKNRASFFLINRKTFKINKEIKDTMINSAEKNLESRFDSIVKSKNNEPKKRGKVKNNWNDFSFNELFSFAPQN